jgi:hypothetical protein
MRTPAGSSQTISHSASGRPETLRFDSSQIAAPAGRAKITARHSTINVRSMIDV